MSHRRRNPLTDEWVLVSPHRLGRPWRGAVEEVSQQAAAAHDPTCALCPRSTRTSGATNPDYRGVFTFDNDHPALAAKGTDAGERAVTPIERALYAASPERGACRVICFSERHDLRVPDLGEELLCSVLDAFALETTAMRARGLAFVQLFENRGAQMGASSPHPHGQIWAQAEAPTLLAREIDTQRAFVRAHGACMLCALAEEERVRATRVLYVDDDAIAFVPFWATWPFEALVVPRTHTSDAPSANPAQRRGLCRALLAVFQQYDRLFSTPMPLSWGLHQAASDGAEGFHLHAHLYPPLLRSATVRKWMVGYEMLGEAQRDLLPETAAARLRGELRGAG